jgi:hypothetical protein
MRDFFIGLVLCLESSKNLQTEPTNKNKHFSEENKSLYITSESNHKDENAKEIDFNILHMPSNEYLIN